MRDKNLTQMGSLVVGAMAISAIALVLAASSYAQAGRLGGQGAGDDELEGSRGTRAQLRHNAKLQLTKLFDFDTYKQLFKKHYKTAIEELSRRRLFAASALRAYVTGVKYRYRKRSHFESINHMSDHTHGELKRMRNKQLAGANKGMFHSLRPGPSAASGPSEPAEESHDELPELLPDEDEDVRAELERLVEEHGDEPAFRELREALEHKLALAEQRRTKRDVKSVEGNEGQEDGHHDDDYEEEDGEEEEAPRELPELINLGAAKRPPNPKVVKNPASNNDAWQPLELPTRGLNDQQVYVYWSTLEAKTDMRTIGEQVYSSLRDVLDVRKMFGRRRNKKKRGLERLPDEMFFDHRASGCLFEPRSQGECGSCYAFSGVALMEWLHCTKTGQLVAFSEQYLLDCGQGRFEGDMNGCEGATDRGVAMFIRNFGMELRSHYPYQGRVSSCPYDEQHDLFTTGYIRFDLYHVAVIPAAAWDYFIRFQPMLIGVSTSSAFYRYGGGVDDGSDCGREPDHSMLLVGHGREDGQEFWLLRNSYGTAWGDGGYYKLAKRAARRCLEREAVALGTRDGRDSMVDIRQIKGKPMGNSAMRLLKWLT